MNQIALLITFIVFCFLCFINQKAQKPIKSLWFCFFIALLVAMRPETMADYEQYKDAYNYGSLKFELLYQWLFSILHWSNAPYLIFFLVMSVLTIGIKWLALERMTTLFPLSLVAWISNMLILQDMIAIRSALAASFLLWIIYYKCKNALIPAIIFASLAIISHITAIIYILVLLLSPEKSFRLLYLTLLILCGIMAYMKISLFNLLPLGNFTEYMRLLEQYSQQDAINAFNLLQIGRCLLCIALWLLTSKITALNSYFLLCLKCYTIGLMLFFLSSELISVAIRLQELFGVTEIIIIPYLIYAIGSRYKKIAPLLPISICSIIFYFNYITQNYWEAS